MVTAFNNTMETNHHDSAPSLPVARLPEKRLSMRAPMDE
jgi:hypothetical protein